MSQDLGFVWNESKMKKVYQDHHVTYGEVVDVFLSESSFEEYDDQNEERFALIGETRDRRLLKVVFEQEYTEDSSLIYRIITAFDAGEKYVKEYYRR